MGASLIARPLGAYFFTLKAAQTSGTQALTTTSLGLSVATGALACLPTTFDVGISAPVLLLITRLVCDFFMGGERVIAPLVLFSWTPPGASYNTASHYEATTLLGLLMASAGGVWVMEGGDTSVWRWLFGFSALLSLCAFLARLSLPCSPGVSQEPFKTLGKGVLWQNFSALCTIALLTAFSYLCYAVPFLFLVSYPPYVTCVSLTTLTRLNTALLCVDLGLLLATPSFVARVAPQKLMAGALFLFLLSFALILAVLPGQSLSFLVSARLWFVLVGVLFCMPLRVWIAQQFPSTPHGHLLGGIGMLLGSTIGRHAPFFLIAGASFLNHPGGALVYVAPLILACLWCLRGTFHQSCPAP
jgi:MHS family proline/betaine transporter-like MFS transporter